MDISALNGKQSRAFNDISGRLSLRAPQKESLAALANAIANTDDQLIRKPRDVAALLEQLKAQFPKLEDFEREFPSLCFALATGVGKTRLMGAFITYLHQVYGVHNFFVLAPNLTIYEKLIQDFTPNTPKYVFKGIADFGINPPEVITGDNYEQRAGQLMNDLFGGIRINVFNIAKINSEVRGGKAPRIKRLSEYLGDSYFSYLSELDDLVLLMDESHRYRASAGIKALNDLNPVLGLELTATPYVESSKGNQNFKNVVVDYPLARAMDDGFVKEPAVVTQKDFDASQYDREQLEEIKLMDGLRLHEATKVELATYATESGQRKVKPFMLVIARDTTHAAELKDKLENLYDAKYAGKVIQVDSSSKEEETVQALLNVESFDEPTEIVIHVNMLKEGWDVTNLYTIVPLRAANARTLIEQSIGRGLRLPYGKRTGVEAVDRLSIVAHDRFQEIVNEANDPKNPLRLKQIVLDRPEDETPQKSVKVVSNLDSFITGKQSENNTTGQTEATVQPVFKTEAEKQTAQLVNKAIQSYQSKPGVVPTVNALNKPEVREQLVAAVKEQMTTEQQNLFDEQSDAEQAVAIDKVVETLTNQVIDQTIDMPRIFVQPVGEVSSGYHPFDLDLASIQNLKPIDRTMLSQSLQTNQQTELGQGDSGNYEPRPENYILKRLFNFDDIAYDDHADQLADLASQAVACLNANNSEEDVENILQNQGDAIARLIHSQLQNAYYEEAVEYEAVVSRGFESLKDCAFTVAADQPIQSVRETVREVGKTRQMLFGNFQKCLYPLQKFDSDTERRFAVMLERDSQKWFKPAKGQFRMFYKLGADHKEYVPDFVAELDDCVLMVETKSTQHRNADGSWNEEVTEKARAGSQWCHYASEYLLKHDGKPWHYVLIPHDAVVESSSVKSLAQRYEFKED